MIKSIERNFDHHVHIGQYVDTYYNAKDVFSALKANNMMSCFFVSTTSCKPLGIDNTQEAIDLYKKTTVEIKEALVEAKKINFNAVPLYWVVPLIIKAGITLEEAFSDIQYKGLVIHPRAHNWDPYDKERSAYLDNVFEFALRSKVDVYIHTGDSKDDEPILYEKWYKNFPKVNVHLAHCKKLDQILELFSKYNNLYGDTAYCPKENIKAIEKKGFSSRMYFGTDFPITLWNKKIKNTYEELFKNYKNILINSF